MKKVTGQIAAEFVLLLPCVCGALLLFIICAVYLVRGNNAIYAGFMASRVYSVWPEEKRDAITSAELARLLKGVETGFEAGPDGVMKVISVMGAPFKFGTSLDIWSFETNTPFAIEPEYSCEEEDNPLPKKYPEVCL